MAAFFKTSFKRNPNIVDLKSLQKHLENYFERDFRPELDQVDYMRKQQSSSIYRNQTKTFKKRNTMMNGEEIGSFKHAFENYMTDKDELNDSDDSGSEPADPSQNQDDYFKKG